MDNEALTMNVSNNFIHLVPYEMPESLYVVDASRTEMNELYFPLEPTGDPDDRCEVYRTVSNNHCIAWNSSKQTGGLIAPSFSSPEKYWFRTYRINRCALIENNRNCLEKITDVEVPDTIHGELSGHCVYESYSRLYLVAKDGFRVRSDNKNPERIEASSRVVLIDLHNGQLLWTSDVFEHGVLRVGGVYPRISSSGVLWAVVEKNQQLKELLIWNAEKIIDGSDIRKTSLKSIEDYELDDVPYGIVQLCDSQIFFFNMFGQLHCWDFLQPLLY